MPSIVVDQIDAPQATIASFRDPAREETLVAAARNGNERAFEILLKRHEQRILAVAQRYTRAQEDAKDVVQQTFKNAFVYLHSFEWKSSANPDRAIDDKCRASCVDWYGNARPLFVRERIIALLGYELVEGSREGDHITEIRRVSFAPSRSKLAAAASK